MKSFISKMQRKFKDISVREIEAALINQYIGDKQLDVEKSEIIRDFSSRYTSNNEELIAYVNKNSEISCVDELITAFELLIETKYKKNNGMVYTPLHVKRYIVENTIISEEIPRVVDPACGCGSFLITAAQWLHKKYELTYSEIFNDYIYGYDIDKHSIEKAKVLFEIISIEEEGRPLQGKIKLNVVDSLEEFAKKKYKKKFDVVVGNPPYVRSKNIQEDIKEHLCNWSVVSGNVDLYIPFFEIALEILRDNGIMGYISPNTFLQSVNGRGLRNYLVKYGYETRILDFRETQAFKEITHYTCICIINKSRRNYTVQYALLNGKSSLYEYDFTDYYVKAYPVNKEWRFANKNIDAVIKQIESQPYKLEDFKIRNGLATLCNEVYFFKPFKEDTKFYYRKFNGTVYPIEKAICIDVIKPNVIRKEQDIELHKEKAIFPYMTNKEVMSEDYLSGHYPETYNFLVDHKTDLLSRDKGKAKDYPAWFAYGRTQGMMNQGKKLLIPYMAERGIAVKSYDEELLFYCGYAIFCDDDLQMELIKIFIESKVFSYYIRNTSKPYSKGYMALAKNYIKNFGIPELSQKQINDILSFKGEDRESLIQQIYGVVI